MDYLEDGLLYLIATKPLYDRSKRRLYANWMVGRLPKHHQGAYNIYDHPKRVHPLTGALLLTVVPTYDETIRNIVFKWTRPLNCSQCLFEACLTPRQLHGLLRTRSSIATVAVSVRGEEIP
jgi:hypothetical protein